MSTLRVDYLRRLIAIACFLALLITASQAMAAQPCAVSPASGGLAVMPNVLLIVDNSGSMLGAAFPGAYDNTKTYIGFFDKDKRYNYDDTNKYFVENAGGSWSGKFLNWACLTRWDIEVYVLIGQNYKDVSGVRTLVANADPRYQKGATFIYPNRFYNDTADVTPYASGTSRGYRPVPYYYAEDYDSGIAADANRKKWPYLEVCTGQYAPVGTEDDAPCGECTGTGSTKEFYYLRIKVETTDPLYQPTGILKNLEDKVRLGLMHFNADDGTNAQGGFIKQYVRKLDSTQLAAITASLRLTLAEQDSDTYFPAGTYLFHTWTPLAETLYEAGRYFQQTSTAYSSSDYTVATSDYKYRDPLYNEDYDQVLWCAKNYVVYLTDGEPTDDRTIPWTDDASPARKVRDADNDGCDGTATTPDNCPCNNAGCGYTCVCGDTTFANLGGGWGNGSAFLDDVAYYLRHNDLRTLNDEQNLSTHVIFAFGTAGGYGETLLSKAAYNGGGSYFRPQNATDLTSALTSVFDIITNRAAAAASTAITSEPISGVDLIYIPYYKHPQDDQWWGNIRGFRLGADGSLLEGASGSVVALDRDNDLVLDNPKWDAAILLQSKAEADTRTIYTYIPGETNPYLFDTDSPHPATIGRYFDVNFDGDATVDEVGSGQEVNALISYIRGDDSVGFTVRQRINNQVPPIPSRWYLGDIMHANPVFVGEPSARYDLIYGDDSYWSFFWDNVDRTKVLYAAANDGMLHCFDANSGQEKWAYIPFNLLPHLKWLADPNCCHSYYVDLSANVWDIKWDSNWKSVLVGAMRLGGTPIGVDTSVPSDGTSDTTLRSAMFALDVTDPENPQVLWEMNGVGASDKFGYTTSKPIPVKVGSNWYLVFGSGPKTRAGEGAPAALETPGVGFTDNNGYIFVVDPSSGSTTTISLGTLGNGNFFGPPVAIDYDLDYSVDMIYIGDIKGNLWRIKTATELSSWAIDVSGAPGVANPLPLLSLGTDQPIVIKPAVTMDEKGRVWIYFGTGRYYCANDNEYCGTGNVCPTSGGCTFTESGIGDRSKYIAVGVYDRHWDTDAFVLQDSTINFTTNPNLLDHRVIKAGTVVGTIGETNTIGYYIVDYTTGEIATDVSTSAKGWYFRLLENKERSLGDYLVYQGTVFFISFKPDSTGACTNNGGLSNLYGVSYAGGTSVAHSFFDLTGEGVIDSDDLVRDASSKDRGAAILRLDKGFAGGGLKIKQFELSGGGTTTMGFTPLAEEGLTLNPAGDEYSTGVTSWREVWQ